jgi:sugar-specific transcriptional regulator TrmB
LKLGLTEGEAKVYAALLELGSSSVGPVTKKSGVSYSNIYEILQRLVEKGIATVIVKNGVKQFSGVDPVNLGRYLEKKQEELDDQKRLLVEALPRIESLGNLHSNQDAQLFVGVKGLIAAYKELFKDSEKGDENLWIYVHDERYADKSDKFYMHTWLPIVRNIKSRGIADTSYRKSPFAKAFGKGHEIRFADFPIFSHGEVFKDRFLLVSWEDPVIAVLVSAKHVSDNFKKYFESVWELGKK